MEEQQIQNFVHRVSNDETLRKELAIDPDTVIIGEGFSPQVARIVTRLIPHLVWDRPLEPSLGWWR